MRAAVTGTTTVAAWLSSSDLHRLTFSRRRMTTEAATSQRRRREESTIGFSVVTAAVHSRFISGNCTPSYTKRMARWLECNGPGVEDGGRVAPMIGCACVRCTWVDASLMRA